MSDNFLNDPLFQNLSPMKKVVITELLEKCNKYSNFIISSGCDIPPMSSWENINAFFDEVKNFYGK